ncbi:hypothetical protein B0T21DRAFT_376738 [Apiosordaria backusii]|uniref:Putative gamma-glutamylcyclotransferase n=1 Tax=Apiosordaria backusii TaxID=314023 RepID=A0AA40A796_9PEZI|nr:hypothetical protein B0T21DRAFT_376738 [Apiosordaria backusii]
MNSGLIPVYDEPEYLPQEQPKASVEEPQDDQDFEPCTFFLYGTLMDPEVLMVVAMLGNLPQLQDAWIEGFEMKMWNGIYPTLLPNEGAQGRISGKAWQANTMAQCLRLQRYETSAYEVADCRIHLGEDELVKGLVFKWAKDPKSAELADGAFDLDHWQRTHKTSLF